MEENNQDLQKKVMQEIESGEVKLRSRYIFLAEKFGFGGAIIVSLLLAILFCSLVLYYLRATDNLVYLSFGGGGFYAFLESFPYLLVISVIVCLFVTGLLLKRSGTLYKKPFAYLALGIVALTLIAGAAVAFTSVWETVEQEDYHGSGLMFRPLLHREFGDDHGLAGCVTMINKNVVTVATPLGTRTLMIGSQLEPLLQTITIGDFVIAIGEKHNATFSVEHLHIIPDNEASAVKHTIRYQFGPSACQHILPPPISAAPHCFDACSPGRLCGTVCLR